MLTIIEKVLLLQEVDVFENTTTGDLAFIAAITEEYNYDADYVIYKEGDPSDALYIVVDGLVRVSHNEQKIMDAGKKDVMGTWALFDDEPRVATAKTLEPTHLLRIDRDDFYDLLSDHTRITQGVLKTMSKRLRRLVGRVRIDIPTNQNTNQE